MTILRLLSVLIILAACTQKSMHEQLLGDWKVTSWKTKSTFSGLTEKEKLEGTMHVIFEEDRLQMIQNNKKETFHYSL